MVNGWKTNLHFYRISVDLGRMPSYIPRTPHPQINVGTGGDG